MRIVLAGACVIAIALSGCGRSGPKFAGGKPMSYWLQALQTGDAKQRQKAVFKLGNAGATDPVVLPAVIADLKDRDPAVRCEAILAVVKNGRGASAAIPALTELQQRDPNTQVRSYATRARAKLQRGT